MKALENINRIQLRNETLILLLDLYESKGKTFYYDELFKKDSQSYSNITLATDLEQIIKILNLELTEARIKHCCNSRFVPKNKDEQLIYNIKNILTILQKNFIDFELLVNEVYDLSKLLGEKHTNINWTKKEKNDDGIFGITKNKSTREDLEDLLALFTKHKKTKKHELINLITNLYVDFINMKIFDNYNDLIALIVLYTQIFQNFPIFKYVSFFKYFNIHAKSWEFAIQQANYNWESSFSQTENLTEIIYRILVDSYVEIEKLAREYDFQKDLNKSDSIENTILKFQKLFSKNDLRKAHPTISDSTIDKTLQRLSLEGKIMAIGTGRSAKWQVIVENNDFQQLDIFNQK